MKTTVFFFATLLIPGCIFDSESDPVKFEQEILFEVESRNNAWSYYHTGFYIDSEGNIYSYKYDYDSEHFQYDDEYFTEQELKDKYSHNKKFRRTIDRDSLYQFARLIPFVLMSSNTDTTSEGADLGVRRHMCYTFNKDKKIYKEVVLACKGDANFRNAPRKSDYIVNWLDKVF